jgi:hypothetical protein
LLSIPMVSLVLLVSTFVYMVYILLVCFADNYYNS